MLLIRDASCHTQRALDMFARTPVRYYRTASLKLDAHKFQQGCAPDAVARAQLLHRLKTHYLGRCFIYRPTAPSTMEIAARELAEVCNIPAL